MNDKSNILGDINTNLNHISAALTAINCNLSKFLGMLTTPTLAQPPPAIIPSASLGAAEDEELNDGFTDISLLIYSLQSALFEISGLSGVIPDDLYILHDVSFLVGHGLTSWGINLETAYSAVLESAGRAGFKVGDIKVEVYQEILDGVKHYQQCQGES